MAHDVSHLRHLSQVGFGLRADHSFVHGGVVCLPWTGIFSPFSFFFFAEGSGSQANASERASERTDY
jgi:hypothetical protein